MKYIFFQLLVITNLICGFRKYEVMEYKEEDVKIGAYYFDGWFKNSSLITPRLRNSFAAREPKWGWITSSQKIVDQQIVEASEAGLNFFSFCWYLKENEGFLNQSLNDGVKFYNKSKYKERLKYNLMIANHSGFNITPKNWDVATAEWLHHFENKNYLTLDKKPLITFFSVESLVLNFGSPAAVALAFDNFEKEVIKHGLIGVNFAACIFPDKKNIELAEACGFDILTGYNYHSSGFTSKSQQIPIDSMQSAEYRLWNRITTQSKKKYIPVSTLNWDPRPWSNTQNGYDNASYFVGYSEKSVQKSVSGLIKWIHNNPERATSEKIALLYAWNENGEGAYLTPTKDGKNFLKGVTKALKANR